MARRTRAQREWRPGTVRPPRSVRVMFASSVLCLEALLMVFYGLAMWGLNRDAPHAGWLLAGSLVVAVVMVLTCALLRRPLGFVLGWALQLVVIAGGIFDPFGYTYVLGAIFLGCWWFAVVKGRQLDREKMERYWEEERLAAEAESAEQTGSEETPE